MEHILLLFIISPRSCLMSVYDGEPRGHGLDISLVNNKNECCFDDILCDSPE